MKNRFCITFAGAVGSGKTPIATYLSHSLSIPVFNNDAIRSEVFEDFGEWNENAYVSKRNERLADILNRGLYFVFDASVDREWERFRPLLEKNGYETFIISLDLSKDFLKKLYVAKQYAESMGRLDGLIRDHDLFLSKFGKTVNVSVDDSNFWNRLEMVRKETEAWISK